MTFLYPVFLWSLAGISIPLLIHLFGKKKAKPLRFSSILFLKYSLTKTGKFNKIKEAIILLLRTLFLLFLLLFLTGPLSRSFLKFKKATNIIFLVDDSYSMSARDNPTPFNETKICMENILSSLKNPSTKVGIIFLSGKTIAPTRNFSKIKNIIKQSHVSYNAGKIESVINKINKMCSEKQTNTDIYFFTDMQKYTWKNFSPIGLNKNINFVIVNTGKNKTDNLSIQSIQKIPGKNVFSCKIINWGRKNTVSNIVFNIGKKQIVKTASIPKNGYTNIIVQSPFSIHTIEAYLTKPDLISDDNYFFFSRINNKSKKILIAGNDKKGVFYIKSALEAGFFSYNIKTSSVLSLNHLNLSKYSVIFLVNPVITGLGIQNKLKNFIDHGGNIVFFAGDNILPDILNNYRTENKKRLSLLPAQFTHPIILKKAIPVISINTESPIFEMFGTQIFQYLNPVSFHKCYGVKNISGETLASLQGNIPIIIEKNIKKGDIFLFTFSPDLSWTNFPEKPFFPILINNIVSYNSEKNPSLYYPGNPIFVSGNKNSTKIYSPIGKEKTFSMSSNETMYFIPDSPGFWKVQTLKNGKESNKIFPVNCNWKEGNPQKISISQIKKIMSGYPVLYTQANHIHTFIFQQKYSSNLAEPFLIIAFIFLIGEIVISNLFHKNKTGAIK